MINKAQLTASFNDIKSRLLSTLIRLYLLYKTKFVNLYTYYKTRYITNIDSIRGISSSGKSINLIWRLALVSLITKAISWLNLIKHYLDIPCRVIESNNNYYDHINTIVYTPSNDNSEICLNQIINQNSTNQVEKVYESKTNTRIFSQFMLNNLCLKQYLIKYKDDSGLHNHTLTNILLLNGISTIPNNSFVKLTYFERARKKSAQISYDSVKDKHINFFYNEVFDEINQEEAGMKKVENEKTMEEIIEAAKEETREETREETFGEMIEEVMEEAMEEAMEEVMEEIIGEIIEGAMKEMTEEKNEVEKDGVELHKESVLESDQVSS